MDPEDKVGGWFKKSRLIKMTNIKLRKLIKKIIPKPFLKYLGVGLAEIDSYAFKDTLGVSEDIKNKYGFNGDLLQIFVANQGGAVQKWHHYIPIYDRYFSKFRGRDVRFLEIGVSLGGSLQMWRKYFGHSAIIYGIDIDEDCRKFDGQAANVRIGSQADSHFLSSVIAEMGGVDIILDDGSHQMDHIRASLEFLYPQLSEGGVYMVEDLHTAFWRGFGGGINSKNNFFRFIDRLVNDMHAWYHKGARNLPLISMHCTGIHIHDSIVVLEKNKVFKPTHSKIG
jgi:hypothetical protein